MASWWGGVNASGGLGGRARESAWTMRSCESRRILAVGRILVMSSFFFQAEDGIRDLTVTGVQTCALPILLAALPVAIFLAAYAATTVGFLISQAAFTVNLIVVFNLLAPAGWQVGLVRIEEIGRAHV